MTVESLRQRSSHSSSAAAAAANAATTATSSSSSSPSVSDHDDYEAGTSATAAADSFSSYNNYGQFDDADESKLKKRRHGSFLMMRLDHFLRGGDGRNLIVAGLIVGGLASLLVVVLVVVGMIDVTSFSSSFSFSSLLWWWSSSSHRLLLLQLGPPADRGFTGPYSHLPMCINDYEDIPPSWKPPMPLSGPRKLMVGGHRDMPDVPWSTSETKLADTYLDQALDELVTYYSNHMSAEEWIEFQPDGMTSLMDLAYVNEDTTAFGQRSLRVARDFYIQAVQPYGTTETATKVNHDEDEDEDDGSDGDDGCVDTHVRMKFLDFGHYLVGRLPHDHALQKAYEPVLKNVQDLIKACKTLDRLLEIRIHPTMFDEHDHKPMPTQRLFSHVLSAIALIELQTVPGISLPEGSDWFVAQLWNYLAEYPFQYAKDDPDRYDGDAQDHAWLATHVAYIPTGYGRHVQKYEDAPYLYKYVRDNFFYAMEQGRIDLVSEFVDLIRTYGCEEHNDYQLRQGTRWVLQQLETTKGGKWIQFHHEDGGDDDTYSLVHDPWAGSGAVMLGGNPEPVKAGSYGAAFYEMLQTGSNQEWKPSFSSKPSRGGRMDSTGGGEDHHHHQEVDVDVEVRDHRRERRWR